MAFVNIPRNREDPNYRYRMPRLQSKIEGRGNGIKTNIYNMGDIAKALKRPPMYVTKFFGCELGAMVKFEDGEEKAIINGAHNEKDLNAILDKFIDMYVLCIGCHLPEIDMTVRKGVLNFKCNACGHMGLLDISHKAATYMIRNPPDVTSSTMGKKKKTKEERRSEKLKKQLNTVDTDDEGGDVEKKEKEKKKKEKKEEKDDEKREKKKKDKTDEKKKKKKELSNDDESNKSDDIIDKASINSNDDQKLEKETSSKKKKPVEREKLISHEKLIYESDELVDVIQRMKDFVCNKESLTADEFYRELRLLQYSQDFDSKCRLYVALSALFGINISAAEVQNKIEYIKGVVDLSMDASDILNAFEYYCCQICPSSLYGFPYIVQKLYNAELISSSDILKHYEKEYPHSYFNLCKKHIQPFLKWLRENESEEESSEEEQSKPLTTMKTKTLSCNVNSAHSNIENNTVSTANTTKEGDFNEEEFHDAIEGEEELFACNTADRVEDDDDDLNIDEI